MARQHVDDDELNADRFLRSSSKITKKNGAGRSAVQTSGGRRIGFPAARQPNQGGVIKDVALRTVRREREREKKREREREREKEGKRERERRRGWTGVVGVNRSIRHTRAPTRI